MGRGERGEGDRSERREERGEGDRSERREERRRERREGGTGQGEGQVKGDRSERREGVRGDRRERGQDFQFPRVFIKVCLRILTHKRLNL